MTGPDGDVNGMICMRDGRYPVAETEMNSFHVFVIVWGRSHWSVECTGDRPISDVEHLSSFFAQYATFVGIDTVSSSTCAGVTTLLAPSTAER